MANFSKYAETIAETVKTVDEKLGIVESLRSYLLGEEFKRSENDEENSVYSAKARAVENFLKKQLGDVAEQKMQKIFATASVIGDEKNGKEKQSAVQYASLVDEGLTRLKVAYQQEEGEIDSDDAEKVIVDHAVCRTASIADKFIGYAERVGHGLVNIFTNKETINRGIDCFTTACPKAKPLSGFMKRAANFVAPAIRSVVHSGVSKIASATRSVCSKAVSTAKSFGSSVCRAFSSLFS